MRDVSSRRSGAPQNPLRLQRIWGTTRPVAPSGRVEQWQLAALIDLGSYHGARLREHWRSVPAYVSHRDLAQAVIAGHEQDGWGAVAVAYGAPDITLFESVACYLNSALDGDPVAFGVDEAGDTTALTALHLLQVAPHSAGHDRRLLILIDQPEVMFDAGLTVSGGAAAVALELGPGPDGAVIDVRTETGVTSRDVASRVTALREAAGGVQPDVHVILGTAAAAAAADGERLPGPPRRTLPCAATWLPVVTHWAEWSAGGAGVVVVEHDPRRRLLATCRLHFSGRRTAQVEAGSAGSSR